MGEDDDFSSLVLENNITEYGDIMTIKLASPKNKVSSLTAQIDPLFSISEFAINCEVLFRRLTVHAKYSATLPNITI